MPSQPSALVIALLQEAVQLHQNGKLSAAQALYRQVLAHAPRQFDALHMLGVIARQSGQHQQAIGLIQDALAVDAANASAHCNLGAALQAAGRSAEALESYDRALALDPGYALAFCNRGNALRQLGRLADALSSYRQALQIRPAYPEAWCNSAIALNDLGHSAEALAGAERALQQRPAYADALCARGNALQGLERFAEAVDSYQRALAIRDDDAELYCCLGTAYRRLRCFDEALASYDFAIGLRPGHAPAHQLRANTLAALGRKDQAVDAYRRALALGGKADQIGFALAALGAADVPASAPAPYVKALFDQYADHFDEHLLGVLDYSTPAVLGAALDRRALPGGLDVLDLGCGTGLCGPHLRARARALAGVDLSARMLDKARARGLYDALVCADIGTYLLDQHDSFDLIVAADVLVYFGDLAQPFALVHQALRSAGTFCFSLESCAGDSFGLQASQRYAHSLAYVRRVAREAGFELVEAEPVPLRAEHGAQLTGCAVVLAKPARPASPYLERSADPDQTTM